MRILVTGGAGFIGSHVADLYAAKGHRVTVVDDLTSGRKENIGPRVRFIRADIRDKSLGRVFRRYRFDVVSHHAAQMDVRRSVTDPFFDAAVNVHGLLNILELSRMNGVKKVIFAASGGTYYGECRRPAREEDPAKPLSPYGVTKLAGEHYLRTYAAVHGLGFTILRYGNVYGPRQDPHGEAGVVAIFCQRILAGEPVHIFGDGEQVRDYVFVGDVALANLRALTRGPGEAFNIGTGRAASVNLLYRLLASFHRGPGGFEYRPPRAGELNRSLLNPSKAQRELAWRARVELKDGLEQTYRHMAARTHPVAAGRT